MNLPFFNKSSRPSIAREYFFALEIGHFRVKSAIWAVFNGRPQVLALGDRVSWDDVTDASLLEACDKTLSSATNSLDASGRVQPAKVILGLPTDWISNEKIVPEKLKILKTLFQKLSLTAVGFVVTTEAAVRHLQTQEGAPPTVILIGIWPKDISLTLVRMGSSIGSHVVKKSPHFVSDVVEGLSRFSQVDMLPSRMLLYDSGADLEPLRQLLLAHPWQAPQTRLPFLHFPKVELLSADFSISSIALAGGSEVAQAAGLIAEPAPPSQPEKQPEYPPVPAVSGPEAFGFVAGADIQSVPSPSPTPEPEPAPEAISPQPKSAFRFPKLSLPRLSLPRSFLPIPLFIGLAVIVLLAGLIAAYWFLPTATVTLYYEPRVLPLELAVTADTDLKSVSLDPPSIPAQVVTASVSDQKTLSTSGSKLLGDKATGSVAVINGTSVPKLLSEGTIIISPVGLKFAFNSEVQVASASGTADPNSYKPGSAEVKVTAAQIGTDSNLSAGTEFKIGTFSQLDYVAKNTAAFSGGSSRTVKAVAGKDITSLRSDLSASLKDQAIAKLGEDTTGDRQIINESVSTSTVSEDLSHKLDEEADDLTLKLTLKAQGLSISRSDLDQIIGSRLQPQIPAGFATMGGSSPRFTVSTTSDGQSRLVVSASVDLQPEFDQLSIISHIAGKSLSVAQEYLQGLPSVNRVDLSVYPPLPGPLLTLPRVNSRITIKIISAGL